MITEKPDWNRVDGSIGKDNRESLQSKRVAIVGVGSLGSEITRLLAMTGVGKFILVDPDKLENTNVVRHAAGLRDVGRYKTAAIRDLISIDKNPEAEVWAVACDAQHQNSLLSTSDLVVICGLGSNQRQAMVADQVRKINIPVLVSGVYDGAEGGETFLVKPNEGPCYSCFTSFLGRSVSRVELREGKFIYGLPQDQVRSMPGLAVDINRIATITSDFAIKTLLGEGVHSNPGVNLIMYANKTMELGKDEQTGETRYLGQYEPQWFIIPKDEKCLICAQGHTQEKVKLEDLFTDK